MSIELQSSINTQIKTPPVSIERGARAIEPARPVPEAKANVRAEVFDALTATGQNQVERQVDQIAQKAADLMFAGRDVEVNGFLDDGSGRFVYRISDKDSGQVLAQTPPDALLRFYASYEGSSKPLVSVDA